MPRMMINCPSCGAATYLPLCARCRDRASARPPVSPCACCGKHFQPLNRRHAVCSQDCWRSQRAQVEALARKERAAERAAVKAKRPAIACASCEHGRISRSSETGYACGIEAAMRCRPYGPAALYVSWEAQANG